MSAFISSTLNVCSGCVIVVVVRWAVVRLVAEVVFRGNTVEVITFVVVAEKEDVMVVDP